MISLKTVQTSSFIPKHGLLHDREFFKKRKLMLSFCKSNNNSDNNTEQDSTPPEGDKSKQELLARIAMLQTQKVRLTDYLDERSAYLKQFGEEANAEIDEIGENALRELDEAGARVGFFFLSIFLPLLALIVLVAVGIVEALISSTSDWKKVAVLAVILVGLLSQLK